MRDDAHPAPPEKLARLFGLDTVRIGKHPGRPNEGDLWVRSLWWVRVFPARQHDALLGVIATATTAPGGALTNAHARAALSARGAAATFTLEADPVAEAIGSMNLYADSGVRVLDGITYRFHSETSDLAASIYFSIPVSGPLVSLERALISVARTVAQAAREERLLDYVHVWERYLVR